MSKLNTKITYNDFINKSFALLRTNPKLTSNVKLVVDSNDSIYLSSFSANKELSSAEYKKFPLHSLGKYSSDVSRFYKSLPMVSRYDVMRENPDLTVYSEYSKQYENQYNFGAEFNETKLYGEQYRFLAPIWLDKKVPSMFVVYRVENPTYSVNDVLNDDNYKGQAERTVEMLKNAVIVKTFDLTRKTSAGTYIRNHIEDSRIPNGAISFDFNDGEPCVYHGIDLFNGGFVSKEDYIYDDYIRTDGTEIDKNEMLSDGFERNGMVYSNIINMEFMFDDPYAKKYETYRYFGLYVDNIEEGSFLSHSPQSSSIGYVPNTIKTVYDFTGFSISDDDMIPSLDDFTLPILNYLTDKFGKFYHIRSKEVTLGNSLSVEINETSLFEGFEKKKGTIRYNTNNRTFKSFIKVKIKDVPNHLDKIFIGNHYTMKDASYNMFDYIISADSSLAAGYSNGLRFSNQGGLEQIISALCDSIRYVTEDDQLGVTATEDSIIIESFVAGPDRNMILFGIYNNNVSDFIEYTESKNNNMGLGSGSQWAAGNYPPNSFATNGGFHYYTTLGGSSAAAGPTHSAYNSVADGGGVVWSHIVDFTDWDIKTMIGGAGTKQGLLVKSNDFGDVVTGDYLKLRNQKNYVKITDISTDTTGSNYRIILEKGVELNDDGILEVYKTFRPTFGKFSAYDIKDLSFDFHRDTSGDIGELLKDVGNIDYGFGYSTAITEEELIERNLNKYYNINSNIIDDSETSRIPNQYERLSENSLKEHAIESRVVPTICEFELKGFSNIRDGKYILNANESMGIYNASVDSSKLERNANSGNLEYFDLNNISYHTDLHQSSTYLASGVVPEITDGELIRFNNNLIFANDSVSHDKLDITKLKDITFDYFSLFSNFSGYYSEWSDASLINTTYGVPKEWHDNEKLRKYSIIDEDEVYHKGLKYMFSENVDSYKFMCVANFEDSSTDTSSSVDIVKNEKFQTITVFITIKYPEALASKDSLTHGYLYEYNHLTYPLSAAPSTGYIDTPILATFDFASSQWPNTTTPDEPCILKASQASIDSGDAAFLSQFTRSDSGEYSNILFTTGGNSYAIQILDVVNDSELLVQGYPHFAGTTTPELSIASINGLTSGPYTYEFGGNNALGSIVNNITAARLKERLEESEGITYTRVKEDGTMVLNDFTVKIEEPIEFIKPSTVMTISDTDKPSVFSMTSGSVGNNLTVKTDPYYTTLKRFNGDYIPLTRNVISFDSVYNEHKLNLGNRTSVAVDFTTSATTLSVEDASGWLSTGSLVIGEEIIVWNTPGPGTVTYNSGTGFWDILLPAGQNAATIPAGSIAFYNENFTTTISVEDAKAIQREILIYGKFNGHGIAFESYKNNIKDYGIIKNMYFHKINDNINNPIIKLSETSEKQPLYPLVGEIAIDKRDVNVFDSKYTKEFFTKGFSGLYHEFVHGTLSPIENKAFMASSVMKVNDEYYLDLYNSYEMSTIDALEKVQNTDSNKYSIHWFEDDDRIFADFYLSNMVYDKLIADNILANFQTTILPENSWGDQTTVEDDLLEYIKYNVTPRFVIDNVDVYFIESKTISTSFVQDISDLTGYEKSNSHSIELFNEGMPGFRLVYAKRIGYNYSFKVNVKIQA